jgi:predicted anti-sigma-YlaC factor YlaD
MNCKSVQIYLSAYLDGELRGPESLQVREHLGACSECRAEEQQLRALKQMLQGLPTYTPAQDFEDRLVANVMRRTERRRRIFTFNLDWRLTGALVGAASVAAFGLFQITERNVPSPSSGEPTAVAKEMDFSRDQMLMAGSDPLSGARYAVYPSYAKD